MEQQIICYKFDTFIYLNHVYVFSVRHYVTWCTLTAVRFGDYPRKCELFIVVWLEANLQKVMQQANEHWVRPNQISKT